MQVLQATVPEDPRRPGYDILGVGLEARGHFIHEAMARDGQPLEVGEIGARARALAAEHGIPFNDRTFAPDVTGNHLRQYLRDKMGYAEQLPDKRWCLTDLAQQRIAGGRSQARHGQVAPIGTILPPEVRTVDDKGRVLLSRHFANATVTIEEISDTEIRIRKAVVVPEAALPLMEDHIKPLSDRDRDLFLDLLDNPPEPTPALRAAVAGYKKRHG